MPANPAYEGIELAAASTKVCRPLRMLSGFPMCTDDFHFRPSSDSRK